jgi:hypothetical protein
MKTPPRSGSDPITVIRRYPVYEFAITTPLDTDSAWARLRLRCTVRQGGDTLFGTGDPTEFSIDVDHTLFPNQLSGLSAFGSVRPTASGSIVRARVLSPVRLFLSLTILPAVAIFLLVEGPVPRWLSAILGVGFVVISEVVRCISDGRAMKRLFVSLFLQS